MLSANFKDAHARVASRDMQELVLGCDTNSLDGSHLLTNWLARLCLYASEESYEMRGGNMFQRNISVSRRTRRKDGLLLWKAKRCCSGRCYRVRGNNQISSAL